MILNLVKKEAMFDEICPEENIFKIHAGAVNCSAKNKYDV